MISRKFLFVSLLAASTLVACSEEPVAERIMLSTPGMAALDLPFPEAVLVGDTLYLSGNGGINLDTMTVPEDPREEAELLLQNISNVLALADMTMDDLVTVTIYCPDLSLYGVFNEVYKSKFGDYLPARAFVGSGELLFGMRFELQAIAVRR